MQGFRGIKPALFFPEQWLIMGIVTANAIFIFFTVFDLFGAVDTFVKIVLYIVMTGETLVFFKKVFTVFTYI